MARHVLAEPRMRLVLVALLAGGCLSSSGGSFRPAVIPKLSELPADSGKRDAVLDSANDTTGPEHGGPAAQPLTKPERRAVTAASFAAAALGSIFSTTENVTLGAATTIDENDVVAPAPPVAKPEEKKPETPPSEPLVPWVKLKK